METYTTFHLYNTIIQENKLGSEQVIKPEAAKKLKASALPTALYLPNRMWLTIFDL